MDRQACHIDKVPFFGQNVSYNEHKDEPGTQARRAKQKKCSPWGRDRGKGSLRGTVCGKGSPRGMVCGTGSPRGTSF